MFFITIMGAYESYSKEYDCYIELKGNKEIRRTTIDYYKKKPQWNEMFLFKNKSDKIELTVYDSNRFFPNTVISYSKHKLTFKNKYNYSIVQNIEIKYGIINDTTIENNILKKEVAAMKQNYNYVNKKLQLMDENNNNLLMKLSDKDNKIFNLNNELERFQNNYYNVLQENRSLESKNIKLNNIVKGSSNEYQLLKIQIDNLFDLQEDIKESIDDQLEQIDEEFEIEQDEKLKELEKEKLEELEELEEDEFKDEKLKELEKEKLEEKELEEDEFTPMKI